MRTEPMGRVEPPALAAAAAALVRAEQRIDLLGRCLPRNGRAQIELWLGARARGQRAVLSLQYPAPADLRQLQAELSRLERWALGEGPLGELYAERAAELALDAELAGLVGTPGFAPAARRRHSERATPEWVTALWLSRSWLTAGLSDEDESGARAARAAASPRESLARVISRELGRLRLPARVVVVRELGSRAATGEGVIYVRAGEVLPSRSALRIAQHEVFGHLLPRLRARRHPCGLFSAASAGAGADEEGRALLIEARGGLLDGARRYELACRHLAARAVAHGADAHECVDLLEREGCPRRSALEAYVRAARGGGLCRELDYLPARQRVGAAFEEDPELERWLENGRLSVEAAHRLRDAGVMPASGPERGPERYRGLPRKPPPSRERAPGRHHEPPATSEEPGSNLALSLRGPSR